MPTSLRDSRHFLDGIVLGILMMVASHRATITYGDLAILAFDDPNVGASAVHLDKVTQSADRLAAMNPEWSRSLPALIVNKGKGVPGGSMEEGKLGGFYAWAAEHNMTSANLHKLVIEMQNRSYAHVRNLLNPK
jgi:hypothetical protein